MEPNFEKKKHTWWEDLPDDWKKIFIYDYLRTTPNSISDIAWQCREITGNSEDGILTGFVNTELLLHNHNIPTIVISIHARNTIELFDFSGNINTTFSFQGSRFTIDWDFYPKSSFGVRSLKKLQILRLYKENNDITKQPIINVEDLKTLSQLRELNLHISHTNHIQELLQLNLPELQKIIFYTGINQNSYFYDKDEEELIRFFEKRTPIKLEICCYPD